MMAEFLNCLLFTLKQLLTKWQLTFEHTKRVARAKDADDGDILYSALGPARCQHLSIAACKQRHKLAGK